MSSFRTWRRTDAFCSGSRPCISRSTAGMGKPRSANSTGWTGPISTTSPKTASTSSLMRRVRVAAPITRFTCVRPTVRRQSRWDAASALHSPWITNGCSPATLKSPAQFILQPTGAGEARTVTHDQIDHSDGIFLPDAKRVLFYGREPGRPARLFLLDLDTGATRPITPEGVAGYALSPDGKYVVAKSKQAWLRWPIEGGDPTPVTGLKAGE